MAKFASVAKGKRARKRISFTALDGSEVECDVGILNGDDDDAILVAASAHARASGAEAKDGNPIFAFAVDCETVARAFIDPESPTDKPERFFADANEVRKNLDRDRIFYLAEQQRAFQETVSPPQREQTVDEYLATVFRVARLEEGDELPFEISRQRAHWSFTRRMARQLSTLLLDRSLTGSGDGAVGEPSFNA